MSLPFQALAANAAHGRPTRSRGYGPLIPDPACGLALPPRLSLQDHLARGLPMSDGNPTPSNLDGMGAYRGLSEAASGRCPGATVRG